MQADVRENLLIPQILFGSERQVQKAWRTIVRRAWKQKDWSEALSQLDTVSAEQIDALIVSSSPLMRSVHPDCWRMYIVGEAFKDIALKAMSPGPEGMDDFDALLLEGMKHLWFTTGLLELGNGRFNLSHLPRSRPIIDVLYDYVDHFACWLPQLVTLEDLFFDDFKLSGGYINRRCPWAYSIVCLAADCDVELPLEADSSGEILVDSLVRTGLIEPFNGRFRARRTRSNGTQHNGSAAGHG